MHLHRTDKKLYQKAYKVEVVDSTGAGDSFAGCFLACLSLGMEIRECLKYASLSGAYCCKGLGGMYSSVPLEVLELFLKEQNGKKRALKLCFFPTESAAFCAISQSLFL